ncbi:MAG: alcohol dehydrogenase catalytic domain-containing protein [Clostridia bacterium]|nr:alcohol dehydrogenase catalytic domain-containing protein [Clostridia bacterium]
MDNWILRGASNLVNSPRQERAIQPDEVKVRVTHLMVSTYDSLLFAGELKADYPKTIGRFAIGRIVECGKNCYGLEQGMRVCLNPMRSCGTCLACKTGKPSLCSKVQVAGKDFDGFLRDFVVCKYNEVSQLPNTVGDIQALSIETVALGERIYDKLNLSAGQYVAVIGGNHAGIVIAQLLQFHKLIPILIDNNPASLNRAKSCGIEYTFKAEDDLLQHIKEVTSGHMCDGSVYITCSRLDPSLAIRVLSYNKVAILGGFAPVNFNIPSGELVDKCTTLLSVMGGYGYIDTAINLLLHGAVTLDCFEKEILSEYNPAKVIGDGVNEGASQRKGKLTIFKMVI